MRAILGVAGWSSGERSTTGNAGLKGGQDTGEGAAVVEAAEDDDDAAADPLEDLADLVGFGMSVGSWCGTLFPPKRECVRGLGLTGENMTETRGSDEAVHTKQKAKSERNKNKKATVRWCVRDKL